VEGIGGQVYEKLWSEQAPLKEKVVLICLPTRYYYE